MGLMFLFESNPLSFIYYLKLETGNVGFMPSALNRVEFGLWPSQDLKCLMWLVEEKKQYVHCKT